MATWPSGKAGVCKTPIAGSNPAVASQSGLSQLFEKADRAIAGRLSCFAPDCMNAPLRLRKNVLF